MPTPTEPKILGELSLDLAYDILAMHEAWQDAERRAAHWEKMYLIADEHRQVSTRAGDKLTETIVLAALAGAGLPTSAPAQLSEYDQQTVAATMPAEDSATS